MPLQRLVGNVYSVFVEILLWLLPIAGAGAGYFGSEYVDISPFLGILLGILAGLILDVILFGPIIIILNIRMSLRNIDFNLRQV
jgi:hypothetical protein